MRNVLRRRMFLVSSLVCAIVMTPTVSRATRAPVPLPVLISKVLSLMEGEQSAARRAALADTLSRLVATVRPTDCGPELIDGISALLEDDEETVRRAAAHSLAHIGPPARRALPALERALSKEMRGQVIVPPGTAATMVGAVVSIHGMMGLAEWPETQD